MLPCCSAAGRRHFRLSKVLRSWPSHGKPDPCPLLMLPCLARIDFGAHSWDAISNCSVRSISIPIFVFLWLFVSSLLLLFPSFFLFFFSFFLSLSVSIFLYFRTYSNPRYMQEPSRQACCTKLLQQESRSGASVHPPNRCEASENTRS